jgi:hypothetical protein
MSTYKGIKGYKVQSLASDPSSPLTGQLWFNTTTGVLKFYNGSSTQTITVS